MEFAQLSSCDQTWSHGHIEEDSKTQLKAQMVWSWPWVTSLAKCELSSTTHLYFCLLQDMKSFTLHPSSYFYRVGCNSFSACHDVTGQTYLYYLHIYLFILNLLYLIRFWLIHTLCCQGSRSYRCLSLQTQMTSSALKGQDGPDWSCWETCDATVKPVLFKPH